MGLPLSHTGENSGGFTRKGYAPSVRRQSRQRLGCVTRPYAARQGCRALHMHGK